MPRATDPVADLSRTELAISAYDTLHAEFVSMTDRPEMPSQEEMQRAMRALDQAGREIGFAFWTETQDRNALDHCLNLVREEAPKNLGWLRERVATWRKRQACLPSNP